MEDTCNSGCCYEKQHIGNLDNTLNEFKSRERVAQSLAEDQMVPPGISVSTTSIQKSEQEQVYFKCDADSYTNNDATSWEDILIEFESEERAGEHRMDPLRIEAD